MVEEQMSKRQFAHLINRSDTYVGSKVTDGTIVKGVIKNGPWPKFIPSIAIEELGIEVPGFVPKEVEEQNDQSGRDYTDGIPDDTKVSESERLIKLYKARQARLEFEEVEGNLINKGLVYSKLYEFAQGVRDAIMNVPDRCIDNVLAAEGRNMAIKVMGDELSAALEALSRVKELEIMEKR